MSSTKKYGHTTLGPAIEEAIKAYLSTSKTVLVPKEPTPEMVKRMGLSYLTPDEAKSCLKYVIAAAPDPLNDMRLNQPESPKLSPERFPSGYEIARMEYDANYCFGNGNSKS